MIQTALNLISFIKELMGTIFTQSPQPTVVLMPPAPAPAEPDYVLSADDVTAANQFLRGVRPSDLNIERLSDKLLTQPRPVSDVAVAALLVGGLNLFVQDTTHPNYLTGLYRHFDASSSISWN